MSVACIDKVICIWFYADLGAVNRLSSRAIKQIRNLTSSPYDPESVLLNPTSSSEDILLKVR